MLCLVLFTTIIALCSAQTRLVFCILTKKQKHINLCNPFDNILLIFNSRTWKTLSHIKSTFTKMYVFK